MVEQPGPLGGIYSFLLVSFIYFLRYSNAMFWSWVNLPLFQILLPVLIFISYGRDRDRIDTLRSQNDFFGWVVRATLDVANYSLLNVPNSLDMDIWVQLLAYYVALPVVAIWGLLYTILALPLTLPTLPWNIFYTYVFTLFAANNDEDDEF